MESKGRKGSNAPAVALGYPVQVRWIVPTLLPLFLAACTSVEEPFEEEPTPGDDDTTGDPTADDDDSAPTLPTAVAAADVTSGEIPLTVTFSATGSEAGVGLASLSWDLGDGERADGEEVVHTYLASGEITATLTVTDLLGEFAQANVDVSVQPATCPTLGEAVQVGTVAHDAIDEVSGVVESRRNPGVLWVHNDSGDGPHLYALTPEGTHLGVYTLADTPSGDWEDMAIAVDRGSGESLIYVGDVGDNGHSRETVQVHVVPEPEVSPNQEPVEVELEAITLQLDYPDDLSLDCETLLVDPANGDIYLVSKEGDSPARAFVKPAPHTAGERAEMAQVAELEAGGVLASGITTGGEFSPLGDRVVVRGYGPVARLWLRDRAVSVDDTLATTACEITLPLEMQAEAIGFAADGTSLYTIPEGSDAVIHHTPFALPE